MIVANLVLLALLGQNPAISPTELVGRLGSGRYAERQAAADALERLGRQGLPALHLGRDARDAEIRSRAAQLINKIEGALLTQPTLVTLDFDDRPLKEVVKEISDRSGIRVALMPEHGPTWDGRRVTVRESAPLPFWKMIDRLCDAGQLQYNIMNVHHVGSEAVFPLFGGQRATGPNWDTGPFRVNLVNIHFQRDLNFTTQPSAPRPNLPPIPGQPDSNRNPHAAVVVEQFTAHLQVAAEPRLSLSQVGQPRIIEAVDDRGQTLVVPASGGAQVQRYAGYFGMSGSSALQVQLPLHRPEQPGKSIRRLRGTLPVMVTTRKPSPLIVPLGGAMGKSFQNDDVTLVVQDVQIDPNTHQASIELSVRPGRVQGTASAAGSNNGEFAPQRPDMHQQQIELTDAQGHLVHWYPSNFDAEGSRMTLTLRDQAAPAELRYYSLSRASTEVDFEFAGVPLP